MEFANSRSDENINSIGVRAFVYGRPKTCPNDKSFPRADSYTFKLRRQYVTIIITILLLILVTIIIVCARAETCPRSFFHVVRPASLSRPISVRDDVRRLSLVSFTPRRYVYGLARLRVCVRA